LIEPSDIKYPIQGYVTSKPITKEVTRLWLQKNGFPDKTLINVGANTSKVEALLAEKCDVFVDDYIVNFMECQNKGILCYLMTRPHNEKDDVGHFRVNNFQEFLKKL